MPKVKSSPISVVNARISFPKLWRAEAFDKNNPDAVKKFGANFIIDEKTTIRQKVDNSWKTLTLADVVKMANGLCKEYFGKALTRDSFESKYYFVRSGDEMSAKAEEPMPEYEGHEIMLAGAWENNPPIVLNMARHKITSEQDDEIYAGCRVNVSVHIEPWKNEQFKNKGCRAILRAVQFAGDDEPFGAPPADIDDEFDDISETEEL